MSPQNPHLSDISVKHITDCSLTGVLFLLAFIIVGASGMVGVSTALNALSNHSLCTNYFSIIAAIMIGMCASMRKFENLAFITWAGFASVFIAVFIVV